MRLRWRRDFRDHTHGKQVWLAIPERTIAYLCDAQRHSLQSQIPVCPYGKNDVLEPILGRLAAGEDLSMDEMSQTIDQVVEGHCTEGQIGVLLTALRAKGETAQEVAGAAAALRRHMTPIRTARAGVIDTCGTGGDGSGTFNISTAAALVAAAAGVPVAKHGNRAASSRSGSADVLAALGVNINAELPRVEKCLDELGICFCFAPLVHPSMKKVADVRRKLGVPTIFNLLGPLANPAGAKRQLVGVGDPERRALLAEALRLLGTERSLVVQGEDGLDEVTLGGPTRVTEVAGGSLRNFSWTPSDFGFARSGLESMTVDGPAESAEVIQQILNGRAGPPRDIVVINAAAALWTAGRAETPLACAQLATSAIDQGAAAELLSRLGELTNR
jgi:anthranilate phosphoribosyltransferase